VTLGECRKLAISWPPQHFKTWSTTVRYPLWRMLREPGLRVGVGTYNQRYANKISKWTRRIVERLGLAAEGAVDSWALPNGSTYIARGAGVGLAGEPVDLWVCDDPFKNREQADSPTIQEKVYEWHMDDVTPRIQQGGACVVIHTRWAAGDLIGRILQSEDKGAWKFVRLPAVAETQEERDRVHARLGLPLGEPDPIGRGPGEPLCPAAFSAESLADKRRVLGVGFESLYQQDEIPRGGTFFRRDWFPAVPAAPDGCAWERYWDLASSRADSACYTSGVLMGKHGDGAAARYYVGDVVRGRWAPAERNNVLLQTAQADRARPGFRRTWFEAPVFDKDRAAARAIVAKLAGHAVAADDVGGQGSKELRAEPLAGAAEAGLVSLVAGAWNAAYLTEMEGFPRGAYKDQCLPGGTPILTGRGWVPIEHVTTTDDVLTRDGWHRVLESGLTSPSADTVFIEYQNGCILECTHSHPVYVGNRGFVHAADVRVGDEGLTWLLKSKSLIGTGRSGAATLNPNSGPTASIFGGTSAGDKCTSTGRSGNTLMGQCLRATRFTTPTATLLTTTFPIWNVSPLPDIAASRAIAGRSPPRSHWLTSPVSAGSPPPGTEPPRGASGTDKTVSGRWPSGFPSHSFAGSVGGRSSPSTHTPCIVPRPAASATVPSGPPYTLSSVGTVAAASAASGPASGFVPAVVAGVRGGRRGVPVFNLKVDCSPEFFASGVLVHNCDSSTGAFNRLNRPAVFAARLG